MAGEKSTVYAGQLLALLFNGTAIPNVAVNTSSSPLTNLYVSLHTADPTAAGTQTTNEISYTGYARVAVGRTTGGWMVSSNSVSPISNIIWPVPTGSATQTATYIGIGSLSTGSGALYYAAPLSPSIVITVSLPPTATPASVITEA